MLEYAILILLSALLIINLGLGRLFRNWKIQNWKKSSIIFAVSIIIIPLLWELIKSSPGTELQEITNFFQALSAGIVIIVFVLILIVIYALINLAWFIIRLIRKK
ncbi:hypothetical protein COX58_02175 [archaeon CG_4_10_14_0_2_um_filter_Archaea_38_6]|nr:MAG: hypothetical protein COS83_03070 [archaeon CG07_land_8_20_14_0_80_38_8]PIU89056.1 MAG: hypothetical protein COS64_01765 [archaeon CG06_land_8_20_14_3_00_37_11]PJA22463.1 MAG: hypothetical protein COX58_02175 [archaeon CG_4_10_14_0_2_um_filter_Archaea_38_6]